MLSPTGDTPLRVGAAVTYMLVTRRPLPAPLISDPEVLSGRHCKIATLACLGAGVWPVHTSWHIIYEIDIC
jgi:hypothetical protein